MIACGGCVDALALRAHWLVPAVAPLLLLLLLDHVALRLWLDHQPLHPDGTRPGGALARWLGRSLALAVVLGLVSLPLSAGSRTVLCQAAAVPMVLAALAASLFPPQARGRARRRANERLGLVRLALWAVALGALALWFRPGRRSPEELLRVLTRHPIQRPALHQTDTWAERALLRRPEQARAALQASFTASPPPWERGRRTTGQLLRLHQALDGEAGERADWCGRWRAATDERDDELAVAICADL